MCHLKGLVGEFFVCMLQMLIQRNGSSALAILFVPEQLNS